jgi:hypothetical protein
VVASVFWERIEVLMAEFMQQGTTITSEVYGETLKKLRRAIQSKSLGMLTSAVVLLLDNVCLHTAALHSSTAGAFQLGVFFDHHPYSYVLALGDYHLFTYLKNWL